MSAACCSRTRTRCRSSGRSRDVGSSVTRSLCPLPRRTTRWRRSRSTSFTRNVRHASTPARADPSRRAGKPSAIATVYHRSTRAGTARPSATHLRSLRSRFPPGSRSVLSSHRATPSLSQTTPSHAPFAPGETRRAPATPDTSCPGADFKKAGDWADPPPPGSAPPSPGTARAKGCEERTHDAERRRPRRRIGADPRPTLPLQWIPLLG